MPANYLATIRYNIIDRCLRDKYRCWQWNDLAQAISVELKEVHGKERIPSKRTIMSDISAMRSGALGYTAPIIHSRYDGYRYANPKFSIHKVHVPSTVKADFKAAFSELYEISSKNKLTKLSNALIKMKELLRLENENDEPHIIYFEHSLNETGQLWLDSVYMNIKQKKTLKIDYQPFDGEKVQHIISPIFIKEYNQRWYVFGFHHSHHKIFKNCLIMIHTLKICTV
jgi:predicted DNA-binding transcriptional regulator YafY